MVVSDSFQGMGSLFLHVQFGYLVQSSLATSPVSDLQLQSRQYSIQCLQGAWLLSDIVEGRNSCSGKSSLS
jgi:hypothetical protein